MTDRYCLYLTSAAVQDVTSGGSVFVGVKVLLEKKLIIIVV